MPLPIVPIEAVASIASDSIPAGLSPSVAGLGSVRSTFWHDEFDTYQDEQQAVAARKMQEVARGSMNFLDKLERVRRGADHVNFFSKHDMAGGRDVGVALRPWLWRLALAAPSGLKSKTKAERARLKAG